MYNTVVLFEQIDIIVGVYTLKAFISREQNNSLWKNKLSVSGFNNKPKRGGAKILRRTVFHVPSTLDWRVNKWIYHYAASWLE